jgi:hypothetical protein
MVRPSNSSVKPKAFARLAVLSLATATLGCGSSDDRGGPDVPPEEQQTERGAGSIDPNAELDTLPDVSPEDGFRVTQSTFVVQPGDELTFCERIPIPEAFAGRDLALIGWDWELPEFTHHYFMAFSEEPFDGASAAPCDGIDGRVPMAVSKPDDATGTSLGEGKLLFGAGVGVDRYYGSEDFGRVMRAGGHLVTNHHVLNTGSEPVTLSASFNLYVRDLETVRRPVNQLNCLSLDVAMEPHSTREVTTTCLAPYDIELVLLASHAHNHLTRFETRIFDGERTLPDVIYESEDWDSPLIEWQDEPIALAQGQGLTFTCYYENPFDTPVAFGFGIENEMCATMNAYAFPEDREYEVPPSLGAIVMQNDPPSCLAADAEGNIVPGDCTLIDTDDPNLPITIPFF